MKNFYLLLVLMLIFAAARAQTDQPITFSYHSQRVSLKEVLLTITADIKPGWKLFTMDNTGAEKLSFSYPFSSSATLLGTTSGPLPTIRNSDGPYAAHTFYQQTASFTQRIRTKTPQTFFKGQITFTAIKGEEVLGPLTIPFSTMLR